MPSHVAFLPPFKGGLGWVYLDDIDRSNLACFVAQLVEQRNDSLFVWKRHV